MKMMDLSAAILNYKRVTVISSSPSLIINDLVIDI